MRHAKKRFQLNRFTSWRNATLTSLARNLLIHQRIRTTRSKAKAVKPLIDKLITLAKKNTLSARRQAYRILGDHQLVSNLFNDIGSRFAKRTGGYTRLISFDSRRGDNADLAILELTEIKEKEKRKSEKEIKLQEKKKPEVTPEKKLTEEKKPETKIAIQEKPSISQKPAKRFLKGIKSIFKKERDSL